jgi:hypothetical protein
VKFNFDHLSYSDVQGYSLLKESSDKPSDAERSERGIRAGKLLDTLLGEPKGGLAKEDSVSDFYSAIRVKGDIELHFQQYESNQILNQVQDDNSLSDDEQKASTQKRNLAINKNTADRHGRT